MGQAVDLPDPMQAPAAPPANAAGPASADDLLSQLAGDEIDRLLAESDAEEAALAEAEAKEKADTETEAAAIAQRPAAAPATPATAAPAMAAPATVTPATAAPAATATSMSASPAESQPEHSAASEEAKLSLELDQILTGAASAASVAVHEAATDAKAQAAAAGVAAESTSALGSAPVDANALDEALASQGSITSPDLHAVVSEIETSLQERSALSDGEADLSIESDEEAAPVPAYLKPLVWINAPVMLLPEPLRDALGKVAILTLFNACAILTYVMIFRRHHH